MNLREQLTNTVGKGHLSYSSIKYALGDMRLWEMYMRGQLKKESDALTFGSIADAGVERRSTTRVPSNLIVTRSTGL